MDAKYILLANPIAHVRSSEDRKVWDSLHLSCIEQTQLFIHQHGDKPRFKGPLHVDVLFYIKSREHARGYKSKSGMYHSIPPKLIHLLDSIERIAKEVIFSDSAQIVAINAQKRWDKIPRIEIEIREVKT